jgi:hypothetical protein
MAMPSDLVDKLKRIRPTTYRSVLLGFNVLLTIWMLWCGLWAFGFNKALWGAGLALRGKCVKGFNPVTDLEAYRVRDNVKPVRLMARPGVVADMFEPPPPPVLPPQSEPDPEPEEDKIEEGGPLGEKWELTTGMLMPGSAQRYAVIAEKQSQSQRRAINSRYSRYRRSSSTRSSRSSRSARRVYRRSRRYKMLQVYDEDLNPEPTTIGEEAYFVLAIRKDPLRIFYTSDAIENLYVLERSESKGNPLVIGPKEEEEETRVASSTRRMLGKTTHGNTGKKRIRASKP